jgi:hypothetical protein
MGCLYCMRRSTLVTNHILCEERLMHASGTNDSDYKFGGKFKVVTPEEVARILKS